MAHWSLNSTLAALFKHRLMTTPRGLMLPYYLNSSVLLQYALQPKFDSMKWHQTMKSIFSQKQTRVFQQKSPEFVKRILVDQLFRQAQATLYQSLHELSMPSTAQDTMASSKPEVVVVVVLLHRHRHTLKQKEQLTAAHRGCLAPSFD